MTDERFEQLIKQALKPEIDERDVVIQKIQIIIKTE